MNFIIFCSWSLSGHMKPLLRRQNRGQERILIRESPRSTSHIRKFPWTTGLHVQRVISGSFYFALNYVGSDGLTGLMVLLWISMGWMDLDLDLDGYPWAGWIWIWMDIYGLDGSEPGSGWISMGWMDLDLDGHPWAGWTWIWMDIHGLDGSGSGWTSMGWMDLDLDGYPWAGWIWTWMDIHGLDGSGSGWISMGWMDLDLDGYPWAGWIWIWMDIHGLDGSGSGWISMGWIAILFWFEDCSDRKCFHKKEVLANTGRL